MAAAAIIGAAPPRMQSPLEKPVLDFLRRSPTKLLIGGKWVAPKSGKTFETINPANEEVLALVAEGDKADVDEAVKAAREAFEEGKWASIRPHQRTRYLLKLADLIDQHADELAELEVWTTASPCRRRARSTSPVPPASFVISPGGRPRSTAKPIRQTRRCSTTHCASQWASVA